jgi:3-methyl-2-oxobutanoate hydroxymethyltransferase
VDAGIAVMGHIGLTPQSISKLGGYRTQGTTAQAARKLLDDALALEDAGCFSLVLEKVPDRVAEIISQKLTIPTIGIGAGAGCDGQVLVTHDLLGLFDRFTPKFIKKYAQLHQNIAAALAAYKTEVETRAFPAAEHSFAIPDDEWASFVESLDE